MKKLAIIAMALVGLVSCDKKETLKEGKSQPTMNNETSSEGEISTDTATPKVLPAITADEQGVYKQTFVLEKGQTYPFTTSQKDVMKITAPTGESQSVTSQNIDEVTFTVEDIKDNVYDITINFVNKKTSQSGNGKTVVVDTKMAAPKEEGLKNKWTIDKALVGNQLKMKMDTAGNILSITGFDPIYTKISNALAGVTKDANMKKGLLEQTKAGFNEKSLKEQFSKNIMVLPQKGAKIGEKWSKSENISPDGKVKLTTNYTLKSVENGVVTISIEGGIPKQVDKQSQNGITHSISSNLSQNGVVTFNQNSGWIGKQNIQVKTTQVESMTDGKQTQSMTSETNTTVSVNP